MMVERQVITTWYKPEEKPPKDGVFVVATIIQLGLVEWKDDRRTE